MAAWVTFQNPNFGDIPCDKRLLNTASGYIYTTCFMDLKESKPRCRSITFNIIIAVEDAILLTLWYIGKPETSASWLDGASFGLVFGGQALGKNNLPYIMSVPIKSLCRNIK